MTRTDPAWLEVQYNNRARVPEFAAFCERWGRDSARARAELACHLDLRYGQAGGESLDVFPAAQPNAPVLVFIHGGWWRTLDKADHSFVAPAFVAAGAMVVVPNYALCPGVGIADITLQMVQALAWTHRHAARYGGDARRIVVVGHSAGGHLAAMLLNCRWPSVAADLPADLLVRAMSISGVFDLEPLRLTPSLQADLRLSPADVARLSPAGLPAPQQGVLYTAVGALESEEFLRQNRSIREAWGAQRVPVCETLAGLHHFSVLDDLIDPAGRLHRLALDLLNSA